MDKNDIIAKLPYTEPFLFVDRILHIDENSVTASYTFDESLDFYNGHFTDNPVTPGAILTETMAQAGLVCLGIFILNDPDNKTTAMALTSVQTEFLKPVYPNETVTVFSEKIYFRFGKLKCRVRMQNEAGETVCSGVIAGMIINTL